MRSEEKTVTKAVPGHMPPELSIRLRWSSNLPCCVLYENTRQSVACQIVGAGHASQMTMGKYFLYCIRRQEVLSHISPAPRAFSSDACCDVTMRDKIARLLGVDLLLAFFALIIRCGTRESSARLLVAPVEISVASVLFHHCSLFSRT